MSVLSKSYGTLILYVCVGAILGGILGELLSGVQVLSSIMPYLVQTYPVLEIVNGASFAANIKLMQLMTYDFPELEGPCKILTPASKVI